MSPANISSDRSGAVAARGHGPVILALATSTERCAVGLRLASGEAVTAHADPGSPGSSFVLALAERLLTDCGTARTAIDVIGLDHGPGAFTGVRIGCAVAQGLAYALERPVIAVSSLEVLASAAVEIHGLPAGTALHVAIDARMNEVYSESFVVCDQRPLRSVVRPVAEARVLAATDLAEQLDLSCDVRAGSRAVAVGNGFGRYEVLTRLAERRRWMVTAELWPEPRYLIGCALQRWQAGETINAAALEPRYVRDKVALDLNEQRRTK